MLLVIALGIAQGSPPPAKIDADEINLVFGRKKKASCGSKYRLDTSPCFEVSALTT